MTGPSYVSQLLFVNCCLSIANCHHRHLHRGLSLHQNQYTTTMEPNPAQPMPLWKRIILRSAAAGAALGMVVLLGTLTIVFYSNRPKPWDESSLTAAHVVARTVHLYEKNRDTNAVEESGISFSFTMALRNATSDDITLRPAGLKILSQAKGTHALRDTFLQLNREHFIPARHTVEVSIRSSSLCNPDADDLQC